MKLINDVNTARQYIDNGLIIAYPTEAVYGLGCDIFNESAIKKLLEIKSRPSHMGFICLISAWKQLDYLIADKNSIDLTKVKNSWPGHRTWLFPKSKKITNLISGNHNSVAIRMSSHVIANKLAVNTPIVSTSANITGDKPATLLDEVVEQFKYIIDGVVIGNLGDFSQPSNIYDVLTGERVR